MEHRIYSASFGPVMERISLAQTKKATQRKGDKTAAPSHRTIESGRKMYGLKRFNVGMEALSLLLVVALLQAHETLAFGTIAQQRTQKPQPTTPTKSLQGQALFKTTLHSVAPPEDSTRSDGGVLPPATGSTVEGRSAHTTTIGSSQPLQSHRTSSLSPTPSVPCRRTSDADKLFDMVDVDGSGTIDYDELMNHMTAAGYSETVIAGLFDKMDVDASGEISRDEFRRALVDAPSTIRDADMIFNLVDTDESGSIDLKELTQHLTTAGYSEEEVEALFLRMDTDQSGEISRQEFRNAITQQQQQLGSTATSGRVSSSAAADEASLMCPSGYFLNSVMQSCEPLGPLGRVSQKVETFGPLKRVYLGISNLCGIDTKKISKLGVSFALSYSIISNINGAISFSVAWYISCKQTGLSPLVPGQWKSLFRAYAMIYGIIQIMRPFRVAGAIAMSKLSAEYLEMTQNRFNCSRTVAIALQYASGWVMMGSCAFLGVGTATLLTGVPMFAQ